MNIPSLSKPKLTRKAIYIAAGTLVLLAAIVLALALSERQSRVEARESLAKTEAVNMQINSLQSEIDDLKALHAEKSTRLQTVCGYVAGLSSNSVSKRFVQVPPACK